MAAAPVSCLVRNVGDDERDELGRRVAASWGSPIVISRETAHDVRELPSFVAVDLTTGRWLGAATYALEAGDCELVCIEAFDRGAGIGTVLLDAVIVAARASGARRLWLITTNDNLDALRFHQRRGFRLVRVWPDAVTRSRLRKPEIPLEGDYRIPIRDELELELVFQGRRVIQPEVLTDSTDETRTGGRVPSHPGAGTGPNRIWRRPPQTHVADRE
jgi:GNAT superfamily N-acetyltransferase